MHPAFSIILFTVASGAGYGLLALTGILAAAGLASARPGLGVTAVVVALGLVTMGLISSTAHLGHPERAWRAVTQWRSSWLAREGLAALATYVPAVLLALALLLGAATALVIGLGLLAAAMAAVTVYCTAMIYRSLKPIHQWHNPHVVPGYLGLALATGALWLAALARLWGGGVAPAVIALAALLIAAILKRRYWRFIDTTASPATIASATGLGRFGRVRMLDPPHTESNYLMKEMGFRIARKHAQRLRRIAILFAFALPFLLTLSNLIAAGLGTLGIAAGFAFAAALLATAGVLVERWLFFAEAKHTVQLYYGGLAA